jgi:hypothetical protein
LRFGVKVKSVRLSSFSFRRFVSSRLHSPSRLISIPIALDRNLISLLFHLPCCQAWSVTRFTSPFSLFLLCVQSPHPAQTSTEMENPLLAMLKQATTASPGPVATTPSTGRENTMSPTAQLQHVSIDDLFKNISPHGSRSASTSGPVGGGGAMAIASASNSYPIPIGGGAPQGSFSQAPGLAISPPAQHQAKLLGMLSLGSKPGPLGGSGPSSAADSRPASGVSIPSATGRDDERKNSLLNVLKS